MGIIKRQSIKATISTYIGVAIAYLSIIFIWPLCLNTEQIGLLRFLVDIAGIIAVVVRLGVPQSAIKFFPVFNNPEKGHHGLFFNLMFSSLVFFILFALFFLLVKDPVIARYYPNSLLIKKYFIWLLPLTFFTLYASNLEIYANLHMRIVVPTVIREILQRVLITLAIILFYLHFVSFNSLVAIYVLIFGITAMLGLLYVGRLKRLYWKPDWGFLTRDLRKEVFKYSAVITLGGMGSMLISKIDTVMVTTMTNLSSMGIYSTAALIALVVEMPKRNITQISTPIITEYLKNDEIGKLGELYKRTSITQSIAGIFIFLVIWLNTDSLFAIMPDGEKYAAGKYVILLIAISKIFDMLTSINSVIINNSKYYVFSIYSMVFLGVLGILTNYLLIPVMGLTGSALAALISVFSYNLLCVWFVYRKYKIHPFNIKTLVVLLIGGACYCIYYIPQMFNPYVDTIIRSCIVTLVYGVLVYASKASPDLNALPKQGYEWAMARLGRGKK